MNVLKVLLRTRSACFFSNRCYATNKKKFHDPNEDESLPSKKFEIFYLFTVSILDNNKQLVDIAVYEFI